MGKAAVDRLTAYFPQLLLLYLGAVDARDRRGRAGGAGSPPADAGIYRHRVPATNDSFAGMAASALSGLQNMGFDAHSAEALADRLGSSSVLPCHAMRPSVTNDLTGAQFAPHLHAVRDHQQA